MFSFLNKKAKSKELNFNYELNGFQPKGEAIPTMFGAMFDGETDALHMGDINIIEMDYYALRERSWELYASNELVKAIISRITTFAIGSGLKLQAEPNTYVLKQLGIKEDFDAFTKQVENFYDVYSKSKNIDYAKQKNLAALESKIFLHSKVAGDVLVIEHIDTENQWLSYEVVDGGLVDTPPEFKSSGAKEGNRIINGVEINSTGEHVAYHVKSMKKNSSGVFENLEYKRVLAKSKTTGRRKAFMVYGSEFRSSQTRGMPLVAVCMQKAKQLDRFSKAVLLKAENNAKFVASIEHEAYSSGENPLKKTMLGQRNRMANVPEASGSYSTLSGDKIAQKISRAINGVVTNLGLGQKLQPHNSGNQNMDYGIFYDTIAKYVCGASEIPHEVAMMVFGNNFSASRASLKMFEEILSTHRAYFAMQFNQPVYESFLIYYVSLGYINSRGILNAYLSKRTIVLESFFVARFFGKPIPHIDPKKEVDASILKIKNNLSTYEKETEVLGCGDFEENMKRLSKEVEMTPFKNETIDGEGDEEENREEDLPKQKNKEDEGD